jgi:hypothetical protein
VWQSTIGAQPDMTKKARVVGNKEAVAGAKDTWAEHVV